MAPVPRGLVYVSDQARGIRRVRLPDRKKRGRKKTPPRFNYLGAAGRRIRDARTLARINKLAIPPAYEDVWICANPRGHLQATGRDARGRKQYRYHADWSSARNDRKHSRMLNFGQALGRMRSGLRRDLKLPGLPREKVLALVVKLLDATQVRVGNTEYARTNKSFGLTTLRARHARFPVRGKASLRFRGKGGAEHDVPIDDARLARLVRHCQELPGQALFQYEDEAGGHRAIDSGQVNDYLRESMGGDFTAKDFRTWRATLHALTLLEKMPLPERHSDAALRRCTNAVVKEVAAGLRNTPAVCRKSYINPAVFSAWQNGKLGRRSAARKATKVAPSGAAKTLLSLLAG
ncbi:MAG: DNA topoisomerase IB [Pseudomonadota bacterium]